MPNDVRLQYQSMSHQQYQLISHQQYQSMSHQHILQMINEFSSQHSIMSYLPIKRVTNIFYLSPTTMYKLPIPLLQYQSATINHNQPPSTTISFNQSPQPQICHCANSQVIQQIDFNQSHTMVFHLPNENALRMQYNYVQMFALTAVWNIGIIAIIVTGLLLIFYILKKCQLKSRQNQLLKESMITSEDRNSQAILTDKSNILVESPQPQEVKPAKFVNPTTTQFKLTNVITSILFYLFWVIIALIYLVFYMFNFFGRGTYIDVLSVFAVALVVIIPTLIWKYYTKVSNLDELRGEIIATVVLLSLWLAVSVFLVIASKGACLCFFNDYGLTVEKDLRLSTDFSRLVTFDQVCKDQQICHLYATVPNDASTSVFFNAHAGLNLNNLTFILSLNGSVVNKQTNDKPYKLDNVQSKGQRYVHSILVQNLSQNTNYTLQVQNKDGQVLKKIGYKTVPSANATNQSVRIAEGGDLGMTEQGKLLTSYLTDFNPDIILLGGDTVYDNGLRTCYYSWDVFYSMFEPVYQSLGRLVPIIMAIGNHDVGFDALTPIDISRSNQTIPLFFLYNPQHLSHDGKFPVIEQRDSYHYHIVGPTIQFFLDSGYITSYKDQGAFVQNNIRANMDKYRFASYHNPIFPACTDPTPGSNDVQVIQNGTKYWVPLFDRWNFTTVLEHHTHYRKMTYPLKNSSRSDQDGTRFLGDGSWGVPNTTCIGERIPQNMQIMESYAHKEPNHFWQIVITKKEDVAKPYEISYSAIDLSKTIVSSKVDKLNPLKV